MIAYSSSIAQIKHIDEILVFPENLDQAPRYYGCENIGDEFERNQCAFNRLNQYICQHLRYPEEARKKGLEEVVYLNFTIDQEGMIRDIKAESSLQLEILEQAAMQLFQDMNAKGPSWIPAKMNQESVSSELAVPIPFKLTELAKKAVSVDEDYSCNLEGKEIFQVAEKMPYPKVGCEQTDFYKKMTCTSDRVLDFFEEHLTYPSGKGNHEGTIMLNFIVLENGKICNPKVQRQTTYAAAEEVLRVFDLFNESYVWEPAKQRNSYVVASCNLPVKMKP